MKTLPRLMLVVPALALFATAAIPLRGMAAGGTSKPVPVSANVAAKCVASAGALNFGNYDPVTANATADLLGSATITYQCTRGSRETISVSVAPSGNQPPSPSPYGGTTYQFAMTDGNSDDLWYDLSFDSVTLGTTTKALGTSGTAAPQTLPLYGHVHSGQDVPVNTVAFPTYTDTALVTITYGP